MDHGTHSWLQHNSLASEHDEWLAIKILLMTAFMLQVWQSREAEAAANIRNKVCISTALWAVMCQLTWFGFIFKQSSICRRYIAPQGHYLAYVDVEFHFKLWQVSTDCNYFQIGWWNSHIAADAIRFGIRQLQFHPWCAGEHVETEKNSFKLAHKSSFLQHTCTEKNQNSSRFLPHSRV